MPLPDLPSAAAELRSLAGCILKAARRDTEQRLAACAINISALQYGILHLLREKTCTLSELSGLMAREPATLVPAVDALEARGMLQRGQDPKDRRRTPLAITAAGQAVLDRVPPVGENDLLLNALKALGEPQAGQLLTLLREVVLQIGPPKPKTGPGDRSGPPVVRSGPV